MKENIRLFAKSIKKHLPILMLVCFLLVSVIYIRISNQDVYASKQIASVKISSAIMEKDNLDIKNTDTYYLSSYETKYADLKKDFITLNASSSLYYIFEISNVLDKSIECQLKYTANSSKNFKVTYSFDSKEFDLTNTSFSVDANETKLVYAHIFVEDLSFDAKIDGTVGLTVCGVGGV